VDSRAANKKAIESLIKCGAFESTGASRKGMLEVMEQAQSSGQKLQQDAQMGQGSIFDLAGEGDQKVSMPFGIEEQRPPIPAEEFQQSELLVLEKETLGLYLSSHPLKQVAGALRQRVDCTLSELNQKPDGAWVTVGGLIVESKKIRTKKGNQMMFATLDDLESQVEILVFSNAYEENAEQIANDQIVVVRGRIDHKEDGETKIVVQQVDPFEPTDEELAAAEFGWLSTSSSLS